MTHPTILYTLVLLASLLMSSRGRLLLLLEPVLLNWSRARFRACRALKLHLLRLVRLQVVCKVALFGGRGGLGESELLDVTLGVGGLNLGHLVVLKFAEVQVLHKIG